jgi:hypothetical protein
MKDAMLRAARQQMDEFECVQSMFLDPNELTFDATLKDQYDRSLAVDTSDPPPLQKLPAFGYTIRFVHLEMDGLVPELEIAYPRGYPLSSSVDFVVRCASLARVQMESLQKELLGLATGLPGEPVVLQLYQCMADALHDAIAQQTKVETTRNTQSVAKVASVATLLGRRAIYFHHIIASTKRRVVKEWALELKLGGFSKIGWPGVVLVEGDERDVQEYVRRLQHLRWKQMTVRGEQTEPIESGSSLDALRRLPRAFCEFPETAMADAAALCRDAGVEPLFLSVMKIYRPETPQEREQEAKAVGAKRTTKTHP